MRKRWRILASVLWLLSPSMALAAGPHLMQPRVPADKLREARALQNPHPYSPEIIDKGKELYEGKGTCMNCHGIGGNGRGPGGATLEIPPRNFQHRGFWRHRSEGEIFWVIKHGSPGTAMIGFQGLLTDEEIWTIIRYEETFAPGHRKRGPAPDQRKERNLRHRRGKGQNQKGPQSCCGMP